MLAVPQADCGSIAGRIQAPKKLTVTDLFYLRGMDVGSDHKRQQVARPGPVVAKDDPVVDEDVSAVPAPV
ncbi:hypothetical protein Tco_1047323 [Tanacetum coccineum]